jgi:hypothetical protein
MVVDGVLKWLIDVVSDDRRACQEEYGASVILTATNSDSAWAQTVRRAAAQLLRRWPDGAASAVWVWWRQAPVLVEAQEAMLPDAVEKDLVSAAPTEVPSATGRLVRAVAVRRRWPLLHAISAAASLPPLDAWRVELEAPAPMRTPQAYRLLAEQLPRGATVETAVASRDVTLNDIAAEWCEAEPSLMKDLDPTDAGWQALWVRVAAQTGNVWTGIPNPLAVRQHLISAVPAAAEVREDLLIAIAKSSHGSLLDEPSRGELWASLPPAARAVFLAATADAWCDRYVAGGDDGSPLERLLEEAVCEPERLTKVLMSSDSGRVARGVELFRRVPAIPERRFERWVFELTRSPHTIQAVDAAILGELVRERRWRTGARALATAAHRTADFAPAIAACYDLLGWMDKLTLGFAGKGGRELTRDELWDALGDICAELRPGGPDDERVWARAKGDVSLLPSAGTGRARWSAALHVLRNGGGGGQVTLGRLFEALRMDFPHNQLLATLERYMKDGG